jgi:ribosome recycling factor
MPRLILSRLSPRILSAATGLARSRPHSVRAPLTQQHFLSLEEFQQFRSRPFAAAAAKKKKKKKKKDKQSANSPVLPEDEIGAESWDTKDADLPADYHVVKSRGQMESTMAWLVSELAKLRPGRADASMFDHVRVEAYGSSVSLQECGQVGLQSERLVQISVFDPSLAPAVQRAIAASSDGDLNPVAEGALVKVPIPRATQESRAALVRTARERSEQAKQRIGRARRAGMDIVKARKKTGEGYGEDDLKLMEKEVQALTDDFNAEVSKLLEEKEKSVMA